MPPPLKTPPLPADMRPSEYAPPGDGCSRAESVAVDALPINSFLYGSGSQQDGARYSLRDVAIAVSRTASDAGESCAVEPLETAEEALGPLQAATHSEEGIIVGGQNDLPTNWCVGTSSESESGKSRKLGIMRCAAMLKQCQNASQWGTSPRPHSPHPAALSLTPLFETAPPLLRQPCGRPEPTNNISTSDSLSVLELLRHRRLPQSCRPSVSDCEINCAADMIATTNNEDKLFLPARPSESARRHFCL